MIEILFWSWVTINVIVLFGILVACIDGANFSFVNPIVIYNKIKNLKKI